MFILMPTRVEVIVQGSTRSANSCSNAKDKREEVGHFYEEFDSCQSTPQALIPSDLPMGKV